MTDDAVGRSDRGRHTAPPAAPSPASVGRRALPAAAWAAYTYHLFLAQPASVTTTTADALREAVDLSLNFLFLLPAVAPAVAPVVHPALEGLFMLVVGWAALLWVFAADGYEGAAAAPTSDGGGGSPAGAPRPGVPVVPFLVGAAFLTNVFYLPYLALRPTNTSPIPAGTPPPTRLLAATESRALPAALAALPVACVAWAAAARPEFGDLPARLAAFRHLAAVDILAHSFVVDCGVFWAFQAALVGDDARRRDWGGAAGGWRRRLAIAAAVVVPFWGVCVYAALRPRWGGSGGGGGPASGTE